MIALTARGCWADPGSLFVPMTVIQIPAAVVKRYRDCLVAVLPRIDRSDRTVAELRPAWRSFVFFRDESDLPAEARTRVPLCYQERRSAVHATRGLQIRSGNATSGSRRRGDGNGQGS